ncbi:type IV secretion system protein [Xanthomonas campestris]|uniref:type IV secretion system protein n=1 Tax=Xanthomonas campestris TaxID=339 RepID=UPI0009701CA2|nr:type IV secretion system protein [Xanthomonas campestris]MCF8826059.1 type IV secretion system protein [Xanthomonas campestris pv. raphani]MEA9838766.1 type IV secretion system protein [Xanthomonas campestris pv. raphani]MEA9878505.1 type IV secretion system protein [Xanthomonas campestris pv. raphani]MEA9892744.1 type IV secretion system protein [Xanthomonas campestris pv. raphani]MEA9933677.1 type IV secretion system protein [Xanthomonas campestris pv. raphani]
MAKAVRNARLGSTSCDLRDEIAIFQWELLQRTTSWVGMVALTVLTIWIFIQGYRLATGQSREAAMGLVVTALRAALIIGLATSMAKGSPQLYWTLTDGISSAITKTVTGDSDSPYKSIDQNLMLMLMQMALAGLDQIKTGGDKESEDAKNRARWFTGIGMAGPGVVAGSMLLLNKLAMALVVGFGPLFILCLLFQATKSLFSKWLLYGLGIIFSLSVLTFTVSLATKVVGAVGVAFLAKWAVSGGNGEGISSMALQQGGVGLVLTTLILTAPPMAAAFFQGTLGQFAPYSAIGSLGSSDAASNANRQGANAQQSYTPPTPSRESSSANSNIQQANQVGTRNSSGEINSSTSNSGDRGLAQR